MGHRLAVSYVYALPIGNGRRFLSGLSGAPEAFIGGWEFSGILRANTGPPLTQVRHGFGFFTFFRGGN